MNFKYFLLVLFAFGALGMVGCSDDDEEEHGDNEVTITILEPTENEVVTNAAETHIHVRFEATEENHEVEVELYPEDDSSNKIIEYSEHTHDQVVDFEQDVDLSSFASGTVFHLHVSACTDHDCEATTTEEIEFSVE